MNSPNVLFMILGASRDINKINIQHIINGVDDSFNPRFGSEIKYYQRFEFTTCFVPVCLDAYGIKKNNSSLISIQR